MLNYANITTMEKGRKKEGEKKEKKELTVDYARKFMSIHT